MVQQSWLNVFTKRQLGWNSPYLPEGNNIGKHMTSKYCPVQALGFSTFCNVLWTFVHAPNAICLKLSNISFSDFLCKATGSTANNLYSFLSGIIYTAFICILVQPISLFQFLTASWYYWHPLSLPNPVLGVMHYIILYFN